MNMPLYEILLVDDDPNDIELAMMSFNRLNFAKQTLAVRDGDEALTSLNGWSENQQTQGLQPRLVILDLKMPKVDGFEVLTAIRNTPLISRVPVVILSSSAMPSDIEKAYRLRCNAYVVKPVSHLEYQRTLENLINFWCICNQAPPHGLAAVKKNRLKIEDSR